MHFDKHKLQAEIERMKRSGEMAAELKRYRDRFLVTHKMGGPALDVITAKDMQREAMRLKLADIADQARLMQSKVRPVPRLAVDRVGETALEAAARLIRESDARRK
jgi:hypothetical protein